MAQEQKKLRFLPDDIGIESVAFSTERELHTSVSANSDLMHRIEHFRGDEDEPTGFRHFFMGNTLHVTEALAPALHRLVGIAKQILHIKEAVELYVGSFSSPEFSRNASTVKSKRGRRVLVYIDSSLINVLNTAHVLFIIGHELGHHLLGHSDFPTKQEIGSNPFLSLREDLALKQLSRYQEVSADRIGLICCQDMNAAGEALFHMSVGLSSRWVQFSTDEWRQQVERIDEIMEAAFDTDAAVASHPFPVLRLQALSKFSRSKPYNRIIDGSGANGKDIAEVDADVRHIMAVMDDERLQRMDDVDVASDQEIFLLCASILICASDGSLSRKEREYVLALGDPNRAEKALALLENQGPEALMQHCAEAAQTLTWLLPEVVRAELIIAGVEGVQQGWFWGEQEDAALGGVVAQLEEVLEVDHELVEYMADTRGADL